MDLSLSEMYSQSLIIRFVFYELNSILFLRKFMCVFSAVFQLFDVLINFFATVNWGFVNDVARRNTLLRWALGLGGCTKKYML